MKQLRDIFIEITSAVSNRSKGYKNCRKNLVSLFMKLPKLDLIFLSMSYGYKAYLTHNEIVAHSTYR